MHVLASCCALHLYSSCASVHCAICNSRGHDARECGCWRCKLLELAVRCQQAETYLQFARCVKADDR
jgi:hypothetical protein